MLHCQNICLCPEAWVVREEPETRIQVSCLPEPASEPEIWGKTDKPGSEDFRVREAGTLSSGWHSIPLLGGGPVRASGPSLLQHQRAHSSWVPATDCGVTSAMLEVTKASVVTSFWVILLRPLPMQYCCHQSLIPKLLFNPSYSGLFP